MTRTPDSKQKMAGLTMIEVLVTLIILSIGFLGMAALQLTGIRSASSSTYRTQATLLADDIAERMRANITAVNSNAFMAVDSTAINCATMPNPYCGEYYNGSSLVPAQSCTPAQMAAYDINVWFCGVSNSGVRRSGVQEMLSNATATIKCNDTDPPSGPDGNPCTVHSPHTITIGWSELNPNSNTGAAASLTQSISITVQP